MGTGPLKASKTASRGTSGILGHSDLGCPKALKIRLIYFTKNEKCFIKIWWEMYGFRHTNKHRQKLWFCLIKCVTVGTIPPSLSIFVMSHNFIVRLYNIGKLQLMESYEFRVKNFTHEIGTLLLVLISWFIVLSEPLPQEGAWTNANYIKYNLRELFVRTYFLALRVVQR